MPELLNKLRTSDFVINVSKLTTGTAVAQIVSITLAPVLYRIYEREHYGTLGLYLSITGVLGVFSTMQYLQVIMLVKEDKKAINAMWLNRFINVVFSIFISLVLFLFSPVFNQWVSNSTLSKWFWMIPLSVFFSGQNEIYRVWANRKKEYSLLTFNAVLLAILTPIISLSLGILIRNETGLFIGLLVGQSLPAFILLLGLNRKYDLGLKNLNLPLVRLLFLKHKNFPIYSMPSEFVNRFSYQLPVFMLNHFVGVGAVGVYNLTMRILGLPLTLIGGAISQVFQQRATEDYYRTGSCRAIFTKTLKSLLLISLIPTISILIFGPNLFEWVFGEKWRDAGVYAQILIIMMMLRLIVSPLSYIFYISGNLKLDFFFHIGILITIFLSLFFGLSIFNLKTALFTFGLTYSLWYIIYLIFAYKYSQNQEI